MLKITVLVFSLIFFLASCAGKTPEVNHYLTYSAKGTRSEARHGHLTVDVKEIPWAFKQVAFAEKSYSLHFRSNLWGDDGYYPNIKPLIPAKCNEVVSAETLAKGYWLGVKRPRNLPKYWFFVTWGTDSSAYVAPHAIDALIKDQNIPVAPTGVTMRMPLRKKK